MPWEVAPTWLPAYLAHWAALVPPLGCNSSHLESNHGQVLSKHLPAFPHLTLPTSPLDLIQSPFNRYGNPGTEKFSNSP